jgi:hypothetical protein
LSVFPEFVDEPAEGFAGGNTRLWWLDGGEALHGDPAVFVACWMLQSSPYLFMAWMSWSWV